MQLQETLGQPPVIWQNQQSLPNMMATVQIDIYLITVLLVNCENLSKSVKTLHFFELPVQEKNLHKKTIF